MTIGYGARGSAVLAHLRWYALCIVLPLAHGSGFAAQNANQSAMCVIDHELPAQGAAAEAALNNQNWPLAARLLDELVADFPYAKYLSYYAAYALIQDNQYERAVFHASRYSRDELNSAEACGLLCWAHGGAGNLAAARQACRRASQLPIESSRPALNIGHLALVDGNIDKAWNNYRLALGFMTASGTKQFPLIDEFNQLASTSRVSAAAKEARYWLLSSIPKIEEARAHAETARKAQRVNDFVSALDETTRALTIQKPLLGDTHRAVATTQLVHALSLKRLNRLSEAEFFYNKSLATLRDFGQDEYETTEAKRHYADVLRVLGRYSEAEQHYRDVLENSLPKYKAFYIPPDLRKHLQFQQAEESLRTLLKETGRESELPALNREARRLANQDRPYRCMLREARRVP